MSTLDRLNKFLSDYQPLGASDVEYPKICLTLNQVRELLVNVADKDEIASEIISHSINLYDDSGNFNGNAVRVEDIEDVLKCNN